MAAQRKQRTPEFKAKVVLNALKEDQTLNQLSSEFGVSPVQISQWKKQAREGLPETFRGKGQPLDVDALTAPLYEEIGRLKMEVEWLKKKSGADARG